MITILQASNADDVSRAVDLLQRGHLVALPTETVYGLAARIDDARAIARIFEAKGRPADNPLIVHVADVSDIDNIAVVGDADAVLIRHFMPGPITIVLPRRENVSDNVTAGLPTVAVRIPGNDVVRDVIRRVGKPLAAPSANLSGRPSPTTAQHVVDDLGNVVDAVLDAGPCSVGLESTVVQIVNNELVILRPGAVTAAMLAAATGLAVRSADDHEASASPGTRHRHYAPRAQLVLVNDLEEVRRQGADGATKAVVVLSRHSPGDNIPWRQLSAHSLYAELRRADALHVEKIIVHCDEEIRSDEAMMNRLRRAAESTKEERQEG